MPAGEATSPDAPGPQHGDIMDVLAPDQAVMPVVVAEILKVLPRGIGFSRIVAGCRSLARGVGGQDRGTVVEIERHGALQAKLARVGAGWDVHRTTFGACGLDRPVDRRRIYRPAVANGAEATNVKDSTASGAGYRRNRRPRAPRQHCGGDQGGNAGQLEKFPADLIITSEL